jgi:hypothetical protein
MRLQPGKSGVLRYYVGGRTKRLLKDPFEKYFQTLVARMTMKAIEEQLPPAIFVRVQKSFIVSKIMSPQFAKTAFLLMI